MDSEDLMQRFRMSRVAGMMVLAVALLALAAPGARAQGILDQDNDPPATTSYSCGSAPTALGQSFSPAAPDVAAIEVRVRAGGAFPATGVSTELRLLDDDPPHTELASVTLDVPGPLAVGSQHLVRYDLPAPVAVTAGKPLRFEWRVLPPDAGSTARYLSWMGRDDDPYAGGTAYGCTGAPATGRDLNFRTWTSADPGAVPTPTPARPVCPQILDRVPAAAIDAALAEPDRVAGYDDLERPGLPEGPYNRRRTWLTLYTLALPYQPPANGLVFRAGCP